MGPLGFHGPTGSKLGGGLSTDAQHGARGGGTQHAVATAAAAGFMPAADKAKLDALPRTLLSELDTFAHANVFLGNRFSSTLMEPHIMSRVTPVSIASGSASFYYGTDQVDGQGTVRLQATAAGAGEIFLLGPESGTATYGRTSMMEATQVIAACRMKLTFPTVDSGCNAVRGDSRPFAGHWAFGLIGARSTTKFSAVVIDNVAVREAISTVDLDNAWHLLKLYRNGTATYFQVDTETPILIATGWSANIVNYLEKLYLTRGAANELQFVDFRGLYTGTAAP